MYYYVFKYTFHFLTEAHVPFESEVQASQRGIRRIHHAMGSPSQRYHIGILPGIPSPRVYDIL